MHNDNHPRKVCVCVCVIKMCGMLNSRQTLWITSIGTPNQGFAYSSVTVLGHPWLIQMRGSIKTFFTSLLSLNCCASINIRKFCLISVRKFGVYALECMKYKNTMEHKPEIFFLKKERKILHVSCLVFYSPQEGSCKEESVRTAAQKCLRKS